MKTSALLITVVVMLHCAALGALFFIQGCGTTARTGTPPSATMPMPPTTKEAVNYPPPKPAEKAPVAKSESKELPKALETTEYVVQSGDSIGGIAKQYGISRSEIVDLNKLSDPNKLRVGQKLMLPGRLKIKAAPAKHSAKAKAVVPPGAPAEAAASAASVEMAAPAAPAEMTAPAAGKEYVVQKGDSISRIAKKCGTKIKALREANKLQSDKLKVGQKLIIPEVTAEVAAPAASLAPAAVPAPSTEPASAAPAAPGTEAPVVAPSMETKPADAPAVTPVPLTIPAPAEPTVAPVPTKTIANSGITHIVQQVDGKAEDINSIAKLYAVTVDEIVELNQLGANHTVKVGQRLKIP